MTIQQINSRAALAAFARERGLRPDWHEPDEQNITARVRGTHLDNAMGSNMRDIGYNNEAGEYNIVLTTVDYSDGRNQPGDDLAVVNLATLLSWAAQTSDPPAIDHAQVSEFLKRILPVFHEPLRSQVADEWADKFMKELGL